MGGSIERGYNAFAYDPREARNRSGTLSMTSPPHRKLFTSGVPIYVMPLDATQLKLDEVKRAYLFQQGTPHDRFVDLAVSPVGTANPDPV